MKDTKRIRGVYERVKGSGIWWVRHVDAEGRLRREKIGTRGAAIKLVEKRRNEALQQVKLGAHLRRRGALFGELADLATEYVKARYARPADDVARLALLKQYFVGRADAITPGQIESALDGLAANKKWSASSRNHHHNLISLSYRLGILHGKVKENPARAVRRRAENNSRVRYLTADEDARLRKVIRSKPSWATHEAELDLALHTGLRRGNMYRDLVWENVDLVLRIATIPRTKNGEMIVVPLNNDALRALEIFRARGDGTGRVVRNIAGEALVSNKDWFFPSVRAAEIKDFRWHDLRHCYASRLRQAGVPLGNIAELLGHKGLAMAKRYSHLAISNLHEAVSRIQSPIDTPIAPAPLPRTQEIRYVN